MLVCHILFSLMYKRENRDFCCILLFEKNLHIEEYVRLVQNNVDLEELYGASNNLERMERRQWKKDERKVRRVCRTE